MHACMHAHSIMVALLLGSWSEKEVQKPKISFKSTLTTHHIVWGSFPWTSCGSINCSVLHTDVAQEATSTHNQQRDQACFFHYCDLQNKEQSQFSFYTITQETKFPLDACFSKFASTVCGTAIVVSTSGISIAGCMSGSHGLGSLPSGLNWNSP